MTVPPGDVVVAPLFTVIVVFAVVLVEDEDVVEDRVVVLEGKTIVVWSSDEVDVVVVDLVEVSVELVSVSISMLVSVVRLTLVLVVVVPEPPPSLPPEQVRPAGQQNPSDVHTLPIGQYPPLGQQTPVSGIQPLPHSFWLRLHPAEPEHVSPKGQHPSVTQA